MSSHAERVGQRVRLRLERSLSPTTAGHEEKPLRLLSHGAIDHVVGRHAARMERDDDVGRLGKRVRVAHVTHAKVELDRSAKSTSGLLDGARARNLTLDGHDASNPQELRRDESNVALARRCVDDRRNSPESRKLPKKRRDLSRFLEVFASQAGPALRDVERV